MKEVYRKTSYGRSNYGGGGGGRSSFGGGQRGPSGPKPVEVGKEYDVTVTETSRRGDGIAKIQGFVIFVSNAKAGQKARIKITDVGPRFAKADVVEATEEKAAEGNATEGNATEEKAAEGNTSAEVPTTQESTEESGN